MKNLKTIAIIAFAAIATISASAQVKKVDLGKSKINWIGKKVTGQHEGTINLKEGSLFFKDKKIVRGKFIVDMTSLTATDLEGDSRGKLNGHLKSEDFFGTEKNPTAMLIFKTVTEKSNGVYTITADLTIKDKTNPIAFIMTVNENTATTKLTIDRTKYDIKYGSGSFFDNLGDKAISNDFDLNVSLQF